mgnify:FL=1
MRIGAKHAFFTFSADNPPVARVAPGTSVTFVTQDCFSGQVASPDQRLEEVDFTRVNPATGPLYIEGAEPGDALRVRIEAITPAARGVTVAIPGLGVLGDRVQGSLTKVVAVRDQWVDFGAGIRLRARPMVGVIGVAPARGAVPCGVPGDHGGNLDTKQIGPGAEVVLPVFHPGGLLGLGDVHAVIGDGEICGTGIEVAAEVTVTVVVDKGAAPPRPRVKLPGQLLFLASAETLEEALKMVANDVVSYLQLRYRLDFPSAYALASAWADFHISQAVNPRVTVKGILRTSEVAGDASDSPGS